MTLDSLRVARFSYLSGLPYTTVVFSGKEDPSDCFNSDLVTLYSVGRISPISYRFNSDWFTLN